MTANYVLLEKITVGAAGASSVTFSSIPQTGYTDLVLKASCRSDQSNVARSWKVQPNGVDITARNLDAENNPFVAFSGTSRNMNTNGTGSTANSFNNYNIYIPNYASTTTYKSLSVDGAVENNGTDANLKLFAGLYSSNTAISSITCIINAGSFVQHSTFYLYGVAKLGTTPAIVPYATGGDTIMTDGTYWYHAFKSSGTFTPQKGLSCDVLVVAGGGSGGWPYSGGGGAGGVIAFSAQSLSTAQTVTVGAGGAGAYNAGNGQLGSNSVFGSLTAAVGGGGGVGDTAGAGNVNRDGGSGGGGAAISRNPSFNAGGTGVSGQGNAGGSGSPSSYTNEGGGGGGGAGAVGSNATGTNSGNGGAGTNSVTNWGALSGALTTTGLGVSGFIAGGGGGGTNAVAANAGNGGSGGGGRGASNDGTRESEAGTMNTGSGSGGGGAGGAPASPKNGGSGLVIVRYAV
jgi:hypothetical protein